MASTSGSTGGSSCLWYTNYRGAVYPLNLHAPPTDSAGRLSCMKSLIEFCAEKIVQDSNMTRAAVAILPKPLCEPMMTEALSKNRDMAIHCLLNCWPGPVLQLQQYVPELFTSVQPLYNSTYLGDIFKQGLRYTTTLAHNFMDVLKSNSPTKLRFLDLTGFPTAEVIVYFLATHCMLAHNEVRHQTIRSLYQQAVQESGSQQQEQHQLSPMEHSLPQDCSVTVKLDAFVSSESTHSELCKALKVSTFSDRKLRLLIGRLAMTCLGQARISLLLKQVNAQHLTGLQLQYNAITAQEMVKMAPTLEKLINLESLDLSCNSIFFYQHEAACTAVARVFSCMPRLKRLDLSNNRIKTRLRRLLETIAQPLSFLRLAACALTVTDLTYLSLSAHCTQLVELDLSENNLKQSERHLREIVLGAKRSLCVLELEDCYLDEAFITGFLPTLAQLSCLMFVNFAENRLPQRCQVSLLATLAEQVSLKVFKSSYCVECYGEDDGADDMRKAGALTELNRVANSSSVHALRDKPLSLFLTELERLMESV